MRIGFVIGRIGGVDGVALETEKWIAALERMGHEVHVLTGQLEGDVSHVDMLPALSFEHPWNVEAQATAFYGRPEETAPFLKRLHDQCDDIAEGIRAWIDRLGIECVISENANALPCHLQMGMALHKVFADAGIPAITHDHDFAWERGDQYATPFEEVGQIMAECFPVNLPNVRHAVINSAAQATLAKRFGIESVVVPNVMDFDEPFGVPDAYNETLKADLGLAPDDLALFQITRIVRRKGIETAIRLVDRLDEPRVKLVITGTSRDDYQDQYVNELHALVDALGLGNRVLFAGDRFANQRGTTPDGKRIYTLSDGYARASACTYFSTYEGFGNAFVEAVLARRPIFVNDYEPVYWPDIGSKGFDAVMIKGGRLTDDAVAAMRAIVVSGARQAEIGARNFELGRKHFSYDVLAGLLGKILADVAEPSAVG